MVSAAEKVWSRDRLRTPHSCLHMRQMIIGADRIMQTDTCCTVLRGLPELTKDDIKQMSYDGCTYRRNRRCDEGNYFYSVLFLIIKERATGELRLSFDNLLQAHPTLVPWGDCNEGKLWEFHGDIIECMLSLASRTGSAISAAVVKDRLALRHEVVRISDAFECVMRSLCRWYVPAGQRVQTENFVDQMLFELGEKP